MSPNLPDNCQMGGVGNQSKPTEKDITERDLEVLIPNDSQFVVHGREGSYLMDKSKWPNLCLPDESNNAATEAVEALTQEESLVSPTGEISVLSPPESLLKNNTAGWSQIQMDHSIVSLFEEDLMDTISTQGKDIDCEGDSQGWQVPKSKKTKKSRKKQVVAATRNSARVPRDGIPIATKAANRAMAKNNISGNNQNSFTILNSSPNLVLYSVLVDLDLNIDDMDVQLDIFKTEELARAKIAEANYNSYLEKQNQKNAPQNEEEKGGIHHGGDFQ